MLMNFVCTLRRLGLRDPLVAALDETVYEFALQQGLPVYKEPRPPPSPRKPGAQVDWKEKQCVFGSLCFKAMTKLKSRAVLRVLKLGYNVLWSDVDITWFRDPLPEFWAMGMNTMPVQSDWGEAGEPANGRGGDWSTAFSTINSGFYFARSEKFVIQAFEEIVQHAALHGKTSEQPSFHAVLCEGIERVLGPH